MKAVYLEKHGGPEVLTYGELPDPKAGPGQIAVDVHAASVNGADWKVRAGGTYGPLAYTPYVLGRDFSGVVAEVGPGVTDFAQGDAVFGVLPRDQEGTYCEKLATTAAICARKPASVSHVDAAALALIGLTALISVEDTLKLKKGETILIHGGAGGVAGFAIELAKHIGARVITTASAANHDYVRKLGADQVIDYRAQDFTQLVSGIDAVFDTVGGDVTGKSFHVLRSGGRLASIAAGTKAPPSPRADVISLRPAVGRDRPHLERIMHLVSIGAVHVPEVTLYQLADAREAHRVSEGRHLRGKLVFKVK
jgi:NADPH:quinone reductase-like Zn-dependent oxidoreductase